MRRLPWLIIVLSLAVLPLAVSRLAVAQGAADLPHGFLFGSWTGGLFPAPTTLSGKECLASPTVIFTRDTMMRATVIDVAYTQRLIETVRAVPQGVEFRLVPGAVKAVAPSGGMFSFSTPSGGEAIGFGCGDPDVLRVVRRGQNEISFPNCSEFPYPLIRCPGG